MDSKWKNTYDGILYYPFSHLDSGPNVESSSCTYKMSSNDAADLSDKDPARNPITGMGLNGDGVGGLKPKIPKSRS